MAHLLRHIIRPLPPLPAVVVEVECEQGQEDLVEQAQVAYTIPPQDTLGKGHEDNRSALPLLEAMDSESVKQ